MTNAIIKNSSLILNSPYTAPAHHWDFVAEEQSLESVKGRRVAGYMVADPQAKLHQDKGTFIKLPLVNQIRRRVNAWREAGYPGITGITKMLLEHWKDSEQREYPFFFCQIEAIETLIWLLKAANIDQLLNREIITQIHTIIEKLKLQLDELINHGKSHLNTARDDYKGKRVTWNEKFSQTRDELNQAIAELPGQAVTFPR